MQPARLSALPWWATEPPDRELVRTATAFVAGEVAVVLAAAAAVSALAPAGWQSLIVDEQRTDASAVTVISITANNLLICCLPIVAGVYAHRLVGRGHRGWARVVVAVAMLGVARSLLVIGIVGGLDPAWLAAAATWWLPEIAALSVCCAAGWHAYRQADPTVASRQLTHALVFAAAVLPVAAVIEVALT